MDKPKNQNLNAALSAAALEDIANTSPKQFVAELKEQGIDSLETLAKNLIATARERSASGALTYFEYDICYKFTRYRPRWDDSAVQKFADEIIHGGFLGKV